MKNWQRQGKTGKPSKLHIRAKSMKARTSVNGSRRNAASDALQEHRFAEHYDLPANTPLHAVVEPRLIQVTPWKTIPRQIPDRRSACTTLTEKQ